MPEMELVVQQQREVTPMSLIERAAEKGASIEQMQQLFELKLRVDEDNAKRAFNQAFAAFRAEPIRIIRDKENKQYSKGEFKAMYASLENEVETVAPFLSKHGLAASWTTMAQTKDSITLSCTITHILGYSKSETITGPMDQSGAKNPLQAVKSTMTYLKVATFEAVCGLASSYGNLSDDGNGSGGKQRMTNERYEECRSMIESARTESELKDFYLNACKEADEIGDTFSKAEFEGMKNKRFREIKAAK